MRRFVVILAIVLQTLLLNACMNTYQSNKESAMSATPEEAESVAILVPAQAEQSEGNVVVEAATELADDAPTENDAPQDSSPSVNVKVGAEKEGSSEADASVISAQTEATAEMDNSSKQEPVAESPQNSTGEQPPLMTRFIQNAGLSFDDLAFSQFVLVATAGSETDIYCYDKGDSGLWTFNKDLGVISGYVGRNGISTAKSEGDDYTPAGLFSLGYAFGNSAKPITGMAFKSITKDSYWVDDPNSIFYNQWVEGTVDADWRSAEHLADNIRSYAYAVVVEYNMAPNTVAGKGSAIFIHCGDKPTSGCITVSEEALLRILKWLSQDEKPSILIVSQ